MTKQTFTVGQVLTAAQMTSLQQTAMGGGSTTAKTASYVLVAADAGTVVQMNSASATTITVNTALFAAGDEVNIQNVGAGVCTVTAGTATVSTAGSLALSQYEGGQLYFNTTSAALFFDIVQSSGMTNPMTTTGDIIYSSSGSTPARLGIGTTGQVVTVASGLPSWATPSSGASSLFARKTSTQSVVSSTTLVNDTQLTFAVAANEVWVFQLLLCVICPATGTNFKATMVGPSGSTIQWSFQGLAMYDASVNVTQLRTRAGAATDATYMDAFSTGTNVGITGVIVNGSTSGSCTLQFAQNTSTANAITVSTNSTLLAIKGA